MILRPPYLNFALLCLFFIGIVRDRMRVGQIRTERKCLKVSRLLRLADDVGWLSTVDEYYLDQVQWYVVLVFHLRHSSRRILDTAIQCLKDNPTRKFTYALSWLSLYASNLYFLLLYLFSRNRRLYML